MVFKSNGCQPPRKNVRSKRTGHGVQQNFPVSCLELGCSLKFSDFTVYESQKGNEHIIASGGMRCAQVLGHKESLGVS